MLGQSLQNNSMRTATIFVLSLFGGFAVARGQASVPESNETSVLYVSAASGSDSNVGSQQKPFKTLSKGISAASSQASKGTGTRVMVEPGTYRESVTFGGSSSSPVTIEAATAGTAIVSGADVWTGWAEYSGNSNIYTHSWPYKWGECAALTSGPMEQAIVRRREQIFVNGFHLTQVLALAEMTVGTFFVNESNATAYIWPPSGTNIAGATVEVSTRPTLLYLMGLHDWVFRGLTFEYGNGCRQVQPAVILGAQATNILMDNDQFLWNNAAGLSVGNVSYVTVQSSQANHNGESGMLAQQVVHGLWSSDEGAYNNWRGAQGAYYAWQAAGGKFMGVHNSTFDDFTAVFNQGKGIHFDTDNQNISVQSAFVSDNLRSGVQIEATQGPVTLANSHICNSNLQAGQNFDGGVNLVDASYVTLSTNTLYNNGTSQIIFDGETGGIAVKNWQTGATTQVYNQDFAATSNTIEAVGSQQVFQDGYLTADWSRLVDTLSSDYNTWWNSNHSAAFTVPGSKEDTFATWRSLTNNDAHSVFSSPVTSPSSSCAASSTSDYWFIVNAASSSVNPGGKTSFTVTSVPFDFTGTISLKADLSQVPDASSSWSSGSLGASGSATLTVTTGSSTPAGTYPVTMIANNGNITRTVTASLVVN